MENINLLDADNSALIMSTPDNAIQNMEIADKTCLSNAIVHIFKYNINSNIRDLVEARWYIEKEINRKIAASKV